MKPFELHSFGTPGELAHAAAGAWLDEIDRSRRAGGSHCVALSGGRIAQKLFASTVEQAVPRKTGLDHVHYFWADERCVPADSPESNHGIAREHLFMPLRISANQIHRIRGEDRTELAAARAEAELRALVSFQEAGQPVLDLVLLGMGEDGHVASLFPGEPEALIASSVVYRLVTNAPKPPPIRVTLSYAAIAAAREVWVLVAGAGKERALIDSLKLQGKTPLSRVLGLRRSVGGTRIFADVAVS